jgi:conserved hypothetical protein
MQFLSINHILFQQNYYSVPDYQRDYEWTNAQNSTLIEDIFTILENPTNNSDHFFGALVTVPYDENNAINSSVNFKDFNIPITQIKHVVDGQQRLTSFSILLNVLKQLIESDPTVADQAKKFYSQHQLHNLLFGRNTSTSSPTLCAPKLVLNGNTGYCYNHLIDNRYPDGNKIYRGAKRLITAFKTYKDEIIKKRDELVQCNAFQNNESFYAKLFDIITNRLTFVEINCSAAADAFQVFDSLNGKGLDLTAADRIKNIFISWAPVGEGAQKWDALVSAVGEDFLSAFFVSSFFYTSGKRVSKNKLPDEFRRAYQASATSNFLYFYKDILALADLYSNLRTMKTSNAAVNDVLKDFKSLKVEQVYVLLFATIRTYGPAIIEDSIYLEFINTLLTLIVRMQVCDKSMNKLDHLFSQCIDAMKNRSETLNFTIDKLKEYIRNNVPDNLFITAFEGFSPSDNKVSEVYLRHIENYLRRQMGRRDPLTRDLTVEHIIPQKLTDIAAWYAPMEIPPREILDSFTESVVENIGNKLLLYADDNTSASNNIYQEKVNVYNNGKNGQTQGTPIKTFELVKILLQEYPDNFNHLEVQKRAKELAKIAKEIWKI